MPVETSELDGERPTGGLAYCLRAPHASVSHGLILSAVRAEGLTRSSVPSVSWQSRALNCCQALLLSFSGGYVGKAWRTWEGEEPLEFLAARSLHSQHCSEP